MIKQPFLLLLLASTFVFSQKKPAEIGLVLENDLYTSSVNDKYCTNGFELFYRLLNKNKILTSIKKSLNSNWVNTFTIPKPPMRTTFTSTIVRLQVIFFVELAFLNTTGMKMF